MINNSTSVTAPLAQSELALQQPCGYCIDGDSISINIAALANNRAWGNLSGSLSVELWALKQLYFQGDFDGFCVAAAEAGEISGQHFVGPWNAQSAFFEPPVGSWYLCLMLREWTQNGYETRDAVNFDNLYHAQWKPSIIAGGAGKIINVDFNQDAAIETPSSAETATDEPSDKSKKVLNKAPRTEAAPAAKPPTSKAKPKRTESKASIDKISINEASLDELNEIKGLPKNVAKNIINARPFASLEELLKVKGVGKKLLDKLRNNINL